MRYETVLFDLDGTLTDSAPGLIRSLNHALVKLGFPPEEDAVLRAFIGAPLDEIFGRTYGCDEARIADGVVFFREYFTAKGLFENAVFDGVEPMLQTLRAAGVRIGLATSKPEPFARRILEHFGLAPLFTFIGGSTMEETRTAKHEVIDYVLAAMGADASAAVMVGDRAYDVEGARRCGLDAVGALYGYGTRAELETAGAAYLAAAPRDVAAFVLG